MILGSYTFEHDPDRWTPPRAKISNAVLETYSSVAYFSWGATIIGLQILMEWDKMTCDQFNRLDLLYQADASITWAPAVVQKLFHGTMNYPPFVAGKTVTGSPSGATGTVSTVYSSENYFEVIPLSGVFAVGDTITDNSSPAKVSTITSIEKVPSYTVQINDLDGKYIEFAGPEIAMRQDVKIILLILAVI